MNKNSISNNSNLLLIGVTRVSANNGLSDEFLLHNNTRAIILLRFAQYAYYVLFSDILRSKRTTKRR